MIKENIIFNDIKIKLKILYKLIISIFVIEYYFYLYIYIYLNNKIKICLCTIGKKENRYVQEFIEHYKKFGVDKIFLYDNNDVNDERFEDIIFDYVKNGYVKIINYRGKQKMQILAFNDCYQSNFKIYKWFIFFDMDEFIYLDKYTNIKLFLNKPKFNKCQVIHLNWVMHTDNNFLRYYNKSLVERFPKKGPNLKNTIDIKSIVKGNIFIDINLLYTK